MIRPKECGAGGNTRSSVRPLTSRALHMKVHPTLRTFDADPSLKSWWGVVANQLRGEESAELPSGRLGSEVIAVGIRVTAYPPHRSRRAAFPHRAPTLSV
jgi:hypothetical protein